MSERYPIRAHTFYWLCVSAALIVMLWMFNDDWNRQAFHWFNGLAAVTGDRFWSMVTVFGDTMVVLTLLLLAVQRRPDLIWSMMVTALIVTVAVHVGKEFWGEPRPPKVLTADEFHLIGFKASSASFPSGHTAAIFTLVGAVLWMVKDWRLQSLTLIIGIMVGISRMAVGVHWPVDVAAGALLGMVGALVGILLAAKMRWGVRLKAQRIQAGLLVLVAVLMAAVHDGGYPLARPLLIVLPIMVLALRARQLRTLFAGNNRLHES